MVMLTNHLPVRSPVVRSGTRMSMASNIMPDMDTGGKPGQMMGGTVNQCCCYVQDLPDKPGKTLAGPATFSFVSDHMSDIKLPVKHTSIYKVCQKFC